MHITGEQLRIATKQSSVNIEKKSKLYTGCTRAFNRYQATNRTNCTDRHIWVSRESTSYLEMARLK